MTSRSGIILVNEEDTCATYFSILLHLGLLPVNHHIAGVKSRLSYIWGRVFNCILLCIMWAVTILSTMNYGNLTELKTGIIAVGSTLFLLEGTLSLTVMSYNCRRGYFKEFLNTLRNQNFCKTNFGSILMKLRCRTRSGLVITSLLVFLQVGMLGCMLTVRKHVPKFALESGLVFMIADHTVHQVYTLINEFLLSFTAWAYFMLFYVITLIVREQFHMVNMHVSSTLSDATVLPEKLEITRKHHIYVCNIQKAADKLTCIICFVILMVNVMNTCVLLFHLALVVGMNYLSNYRYKLASKTVFRLNIMLDVYWIAVNVGKIACICIWGAWVNKEAHKSADDLLNMDAKVVEKCAMSIDLFMRKLMGSPIGFTVWRLFTLSKGTVLTIFGLIMTYFIVLFENYIPKQSDCNCSNNTNYQ